jgi:competence protein ComEC
VVRAALMGGLTVLALALGRGSDPLVALAVAAAVMAGLFPPLLVDLGFQLSFLATLGLLVALPPLAVRLATWPWPVRLVAEPVAATLAAQLAVEPLLAHAFGRVSLIAPLVNLLVVPLVPAVMAGAVLVVGFSLVPGLLPLADLAAWLTTLAATPLLAVVTAGARLPFASLAVPAPPALLVGVLYAGLALVALPLLTPEPVVTARRALGLLRVAAPALGLLGLATAAGLVWLALLG